MTTAQLFIIGVLFWLLGLVVGSFLNVVLYRLPRNLSINKPKRSFCPKCEAKLAWFDNIPVLSWLLLRGRCRYCKTPISVQYPLVEAFTGLLFALTFFLLMVADSRVGLGHPLWPSDAPYLLSWLLLIAVLVVCSVFDLTTFLIDTRVTNVAVVGGVLLHALWARPAFVAPVADSAWGAASVLVAFAAIIMLALTVWRAPGEDEAETTADELAITTDPSQRRVGVITTLALIVLTVWLFATMLLMPHIKNWAEVLPVPVIFLVTFAAIVLVGGQQRVADEELAEAIEAEEPFARKVAFRETLWLLPTILGGVAAFLLMQVPAIADLWHTAVTWSPTPHLYPLAGITFAVHGWIVGAAAGWVLRIFFTFVFGREAFGVGDIYILAAAGACAGWDIALLGLAFSVVLALAGWMLGLMLKHSMMIPFGPWLALGFLVALWMNRQAAEVVVHYVESIRITWESQPQMLAVAGGLMLVGCAAAIFLAKGVRRLVESDAE